MNFDFSFWLVLLTFFSGVIWAFDSLVLKPRRTADDKKEHDDRDAGPREPILVEYARSFFPVFLIVLILRSFIVEPFRIPSASMMPTLLIGDFILVNKYDYGIRLPVLNTRIIDNGTPERGEIVVFRYPEDPSIPFIKRVVGVPGDHVEYINKTIFINGVAQKQRLKGEYEAVGSGMMADGDLWVTEFLGGTAHDILIARNSGSGLNFETTVPEGMYFVLGDNRDNSRDSRYWGFVPDENLVGRAFFIWMNWDSKNGGIGWSRIGTILE
jgi:signal peptidase I